MREPRGRRDSVVEDGGVSVVLRYLAGAVVCVDIDDGCVLPACPECDWHLELVGFNGGPRGDGAWRSKESGWLGEMVDGEVQPTEFAWADYQTSIDEVWRYPGCGLGFGAALAHIN